MPVDHSMLMQAARDILYAIGEDLDREGLKDTPRRFADAWREFIDFKPGILSTHFARVETDQMVVVSGMETYSLCEHHLLPFRVRLAVGYIPKDKLLGLSKFGRIVEYAAHRLQLQERLTRNVADLVVELTKTDDVAVVARGTHSCMAMRGVRMEAEMTTSVMLGHFRQLPEARAEFLELARP
jgi:GTP cyclohydrolase I